MAHVAHQVFVIAKQRWLYVSADSRNRGALRFTNGYPYGHNENGAIVSSIGLHVSEREQGEGHRDHVAESTVSGTTIARFHRGQTAPTRALTVLPLRRG